jgi:hypothetical protein
VHPETTGSVGVIWVEDGVDDGGVDPYFGFFHCSDLKLVRAQKII